MAGKNGSAIIGLKDKVRVLHKEMEKERNDFGVDVTLREHLSQNYDGLTPEHLYQELEIDPHKTTVDMLLTMDDDTRWLVPEVIRDAIRVGYVAEPIWPDLVRSDEPIKATSVKFPKLNISEADTDDVAEGGSIPVGTVSYGDKDVPIKKRAVGIEMSYESIKFTTISLLSVFLEDTGTKLGAKVTRLAIETLLNGEQADGSEAAAVIGANDIQAGITYKDFLRVWARMDRIGGIPDAILAGEDLAIDVLELEEFKKRYQGDPDVALRLKRPLPSEQNIFISSHVPTGKVLNTSKQRALVKLTAEPLMIESEKIIKRQLEGTYASTMTGFGILHRTGRAVIDTTAEWASNQWPSWFKPIEA